MTALEELRTMRFAAHELTGMLQEAIIELADRVQLLEAVEPRTALRVANLEDRVAAQLDLIENETAQRREQGERLQRVDVAQGKALTELRGRIVALEPVRRTPPGVAHVDAGGICTRHGAYDGHRCARCLTERAEQHGRNLASYAARALLLENDAEKRPPTSERLEALEAVAAAIRRRMIDRDGASAQELAHALARLDTVEQRYKVPD